MSLINDAMTRSKSKSDKLTRDGRRETPPVQEPIRVTVTHYGSYTVLSKKYADDHPDVAARVAEQNAAFDVLMQEIRGS